MLFVVVELRNDASGHHFSNAKKNAFFRRFYFLAKEIGEIMELVVHSLGKVIPNCPKVFLVANAFRSSFVAKVSLKLSLSVVISFGVIAICF